MQRLADYYSNYYAKAIADDFPDDEAKASLAASQVCLHNYANC
jgi:hypothetical protein